MKRHCFGLSSAVLALLLLLSCHKEAPYLETIPIFNESVMIRLCARVLTVGWGLDEADSVFARDVKMNVSGEEMAQGVDVARKQMVELHTAFPDLKATLEEVFSDSDRVFVRYTLRGTQRGPYLGYPATGRGIAISAFDYGRVNHMRLTEYWSFVDRLSILHQLGISHTSNDSLHH